MVPCWHQQAAGHWQPGTPLSDRKTCAVSTVDVLCCICCFCSVVKEELSDDEAHLPCFNGRVVSWVSESVFSLVICRIAIAYSMGQIIKSVCICQFVSVSACPYLTFTFSFGVDYVQR